MASRRGAVRTGPARRLIAAPSLVDVQLRIELQHLTPLIWRRVRVACRASILVRVRDDQAEDRRTQPDDHAAAVCR